VQLVLCRFCCQTRSKQDLPRDCVYDLSNLTTSKFPNLTLLQDSSCHVRRCHVFRCRSSVVEHSIGIHCPSDWKRPDTNRSNSGKPSRTSDGNPEPSPLLGRCRDQTASAYVPRGIRRWDGPGHEPERGGESRSGGVISGSQVRALVRPPILSKAPAVTPGPYALGALLRWHRDRQAEGWLV